MKVYSAFCGTGKSYICNHYNNTIEFECWKYNKNKFPNNEIKDILAAKEDYIFISTNPLALDKLDNIGISYTLVYPKISLKNNYLLRYINRGSHINFINTLDKYWDIWIKELQDRDADRIVLNKDEYLLNKIELAT